MDFCVLDDQNNVVFMTLIEFLSKKKPHSQQLFLDFDDGITISTVFSSIPLPKWNERKDIMPFETIVFVDPKLIYRYKTYEDAKTGHYKLVGEFLLKDPKR